MNKHIITLCLSIAALGFTACSDEKLDDESIFVNQQKANQNDFDKWIYKNYTLPYNIDLKYRMEDIESDYEYTLAPAQYEKSVELAHIVKYAWLEAYDEVAGINFTRKYVPKILHLIGSAAYESNGTMVLGTAEGGLKVTLYLVNNLKIDREFLNQYYFKTMHHEFSHILHQTKNYPPEFDLISEANYVSGDWYLQEDQAAHQLGFVTPYSMSEPREDIAEITSVYITKTPAEWAAIIADAGTTGAPIINQKLAIVKNYMLNSWGIDMDQLRNVVQRRIDNVVSGKIDLDNLK
jgi:substrate import-associated zinc metallohydrolase lipoprotein